MKSKDFFFVLLSMVIIILSIILYSTIKSRKELINELPSLRIGDTVDKVKLISEEVTSIKEFKLSTLGMAAIFIFSKPCTPCNKNIPFWRRISALKRAEVFGIIPDKVTGMVNLSGTLQVNFRLYCPENIERFEKKFRVKLDLAQTLLLERGKVIYIKLGQLTTQDYFEIAKKLNKEEVHK